MLDQENKETGTGAEALDAIAVLFDPGDVIELRAIEPVSKRISSLCGRINTEKERDMLVEFIERYDGERNLYFGANPRPLEFAGKDRSASAKHITVRRAFFLDLDKKDAPEADPDWQKTLERLGPLNPTLTVCTGNGWHIWFRCSDIEGVELDGSTAALKQMMAAIGSDDMADLPRIARLPGTWNIPDKNKQARGAQKVRSAVVRRGTL